MREMTDKNATAQEASRILFARQPIYDRALELAGFELLFRDDAADNAAPSSFDGNAATSRVLINAFSESDIDSVCSNKPAFVNFTAEALLGEVPFSPHKLIIEVLETVVPTPEVIEALVILRQNGYRIALDDYAYRAADHPLLAYADIVKLEYPQFSQTELRHNIAALKQADPALTILAEKIETRHDLENCRLAGCDLFQGFFLSRPEPVHGKPMPVSHLHVIQLLAALNDPDASLEQITAIVRGDPFLSLRLLKLINSALYRPMREITSLHKAVMALGLARIRAFASLLALSKLQDKPHALHQLAATRGFVCRTLSEPLPTGPEMGFVVGLFSCLDALIDHSLADILGQISLHPQIIAALLEYEGTLGTILHAVIQHEQGRFDAICWDDLAKHGIGPAELMDAFRQGAAFANEQADTTLPGPES